MKFEWALHLIKEDSGKSMYRISDVQREIYCLDNKFWEKGANYTQYYTFLQEDFIADDWEVRKRETQRENVYIPLKENGGITDNTTARTDCPLSSRAEQRKATAEENSLNKQEPRKWNNDNEAVIDKRKSLLDGIDTTVAHKGGVCNCQYKPNKNKEIRVWFNGTELDLDKQNAELKSLIEKIANERVFSDFNIPFFDKFHPFLF